MNLIVTCARHLEEDTADEISDFLEILGDSEPEIEISEFSGIITVNTSLNPIETVHEIHKKILSEPWSIRYCQRFIPIQEATDASLENIVKAVGRLTASMKANESYRITIEKRGSGLSSQELIKEIAKNIQNKVSLEKFDWNINIEIIGNIVGVSILKEDDIVSTLKLKRDSME